MQGGLRQIMRPSQEDRHIQENTISTRDNRRACVTLRRVMSTCRKRCRRTTSYIQRQQQIGNTTTGRSSLITGSTRQDKDSMDDSVMVPTAGSPIRSIDQHGYWGHIKGSSSEQQNNPTFNGIVQIGGLKN